MLKMILFWSNNLFFNLGVSILIVTFVLLLISIFGFYLTGKSLNAKLNEEYGHPEKYKL